MASRSGSLVVVRAARILVLDPDPTHLSRLSNLLRDSGYRVAAVERPESVLPMAEAFRPDAFLTDVLAPSMEGLQLARAVRARREAPLAVVGMSSDPDAGPYCIGELGADDFLVKPVAERDLLARLKARLRTRLELDVLLRSAGERGPRTLTDVVTGLYNRRFFLELIGMELRRGARFGQPFTVAVADLVDFRALCSQLGNRVCDQLQRDASEWLKAFLRECDVLARIGPGRFGALLPGTDEDGAQVVKERLSQLLFRPRHVVGTRRVPVEGAVGVASFPLATPRNPERFFERACADMRLGSRLAQHV
ncbi:MAG: diguanylate cyclase domain-containing protein [Myxococcales bacterium]